MVERFLSPFYYYAPADALVGGTVPPGSLAALLAVFLGDIAVAGCSRAGTSPHKGSVAEL